MVDTAGRSATIARMSDDLRRAADPLSVPEAAEAVLRAIDAQRDAINGIGHPGEEHDQVLLEPGNGIVEIFNTVGDCAACGGAQYGADIVLNGAVGDLRAALGHERMPWEQP